MFAGDPWYPAQDGLISKLFVSSPVSLCPFEEGCSLELDDEFPMEQGKLLGTIEMGKEYKISFTLKLTAWGTAAQRHVCVLHFTSQEGTGAQQYCEGCRNPGIWIFRQKLETYFPLSQSVQTGNAFRTPLILCSVGRIVAR